jgi:transposase-like protein
MNETFLKIMGPVAVLLCRRRQGGIDYRFLIHRPSRQESRLALLQQAVYQHGVSDKVTTGRTRAKTAALEPLQEEIGQAIEICQIKYLNNLVAQGYGGYPVGRYPS